MKSTTVRKSPVPWIAAGALLALACAAMITTAWNADAAAGDGDATFVPVTPCRLIDTRPSPLRVGPFEKLNTATKQVQGTGPSGDCAIPAEAVGLALNVTALRASTLTFLTFWDEGNAPLASSLNPSPGEPPTPNAVSTKLAADGSFLMKNDVGSVEVVIDVNGYYTPTSLKELDAAIGDLQLAAPQALANRVSEFGLGAGNPVEPKVPTVVTSITVQTDIPGTVVATFSMTAKIEDVISGAPQDYDPLECSITPGTGLDQDYLQVLDIERDDDGDRFPIAGTRAIEVTSGMTTINLVCRHDTPWTFALLEDVTLTGIFVAD